MYWDFRPTVLGWSARSPHRVRLHAPALVTTTSSGANVVHRVHIVTKYKFLPHIAIQVRDHTDAVAFYKRVLGMRVVGEDSAETRLQCGDATFYVEDNPAGQCFFAFEVEDLAAACAELREHGCRLSEIPGEGYMVTDPYGMKFFLSQT